MNDGKNKINTSQALALAGEIVTGIGGGLSRGGGVLQSRQDPSVDLLPVLIVGGLLIGGLLIVTRRR